MFSTTLTEFELISLMDLRHDFISQIAGTTRISNKIIALQLHYSIKLFHVIRVIEIAMNQDGNLNVDIDN